jgi:excisionase family DNA binding protein
VAQSKLLRDAMYCPPRPMWSSAKPTATSMGVTMSNSGNQPSHFVDTGCDGPLLLSAEQVAALLGVHRSTVFELIGKGDLLSITIGRRRLISRQAVDQFIADREALGAA